MIMVNYVLFKCLKFSDLFCYIIVKVITRCTNNYIDGKVFSTKLSELLKLHDESQHICQDINDYNDEFYNFPWLSQV